MIEIVPILAIFILIVNFSLGFFGLIHSGILNSIAARNYAFETLRNRADLNYLRDSLNQSSENLNFTYRNSGLRFHVVKNEEDLNENSDSFFATRRPIRFPDNSADEPLNNSSAYHERITAIVEGKRASDVGIEEGVNPGWIRTAYGICLNADCGGEIK